MTQTVLVVDDDDRIREFVVLFLRDCGYTVLSAARGEEALTYARATHPALILTDLMMPTMSGPELIAAVRADTTIPPCRVVIMSTVTRMGQEIPSVDGTILKPFDLEDVEQLLACVLAGGAEALPDSADRRAGLSPA